jgi:hypothetical protein
LLPTVLSGCGQRASIIGGESTHESITSMWQPGSASESESAKYWVGTLNGVKLRIPEYYLFPKKIVYEGERHDGLGPASEGATLNSKISDFGILLRLSDLQPIRTEQDQQDWESAFHKPFFQQTWMMVDFDNVYSVDHNPYEGHYMLPRFGPYDRDKNLVFGLVHFESIQTVEDGMRGGNSYGHVEYFLVPELNVVAKAFYTKKDLPRWREFEERVRHIAHTFIVSTSTGK